MISDNAVCRAPKRVGHCEDATPNEIPRFYYNQETDLCEEFNWSGCNENRNNFETKQECEAACLNEGMYNAFIMRHDMRFPMWYVRPAKPQISLRMRTV